MIKDGTEMARIQALEQDLEFLSGQVKEQQLQIKTEFELRSSLQETLEASEREQAPIPSRSIRIRACRITGS